MKVLSPEEMREVDRRTIAGGIPSLVLMENAGHRVVEVLERKFSPLSEHRIVIFCGKGNNGGDGLVIARQLRTRFRPRSLDVALAVNPSELQGDVAEQLRMWTFCGGSVWQEITPPMHAATLVIDALLGTGLSGPAKGRYLDWIREINCAFPGAKVVAVDIPSGMPGDGPSANACVRADVTVTFTTPKIGQVVGPNYEKCGELIVGEIGSPWQLMEHIGLHLNEPAEFDLILQPRPRNSNKGIFGHALVVAGGPGKTGAAAMAGIAALRAGAGLVTVASDPSALPVIAAHAPELMTEPATSAADILRLAKGRTVVAVGPGLGQSECTRELVRTVFDELETPLVVDADGLNVLAGTDFRGGGSFRVLTPHPGEMGRLVGIGAEEVQRDRLGCARRFAAERNVCVVLKGDRTVIAFPDGRAWINPTGSPAMATGGTGDILTGMMAGLLAPPLPHAPAKAVLAAVWLHGRSGELGARVLGERPLIATDLLRWLPEAMREVSDVV